MHDPKVVVIIPSSLRTEQLAFLDKAIGSLRTTKMTVQPVVVSTASVSKKLQKRYPTTTFIRARKHAGFGEMNNDAVSFTVERYTSEWILLLNDDAYLAPNFFTVLLRREKKRTPHCLAPLVYMMGQKGEIDNFGVEYFRSGYAKNNRALHRSTALASAGCLLIRTECVQKLIDAYGFFFSTVYHYYLEDVDLTIRLKMIGCSIEKNSQLIAYHHGSSSSGGVRNSFSMYHTFRNIGWVILCCWPKKDIVRNLPNILLVQAWIAVYGTYSMGPFFFFRMWGETLRQRAELLRYRKKTLAAYKEPGQFSAVLSPYSFRTYHDVTIPAL